MPAARKVISASNSPPSVSILRVLLNECTECYRSFVMGERTAQTPLRSMSVSNTGGCHCCCVCSSRHVCSLKWARSPSSRLLVILGPHWSPKLGVSICSPASRSWVGREKSTNAGNVVVLSLDLAKQATLQQCWFEWGLTIDSCEENKPKVSPKCGVKGGRSGDEATAKMKHTKGIYRPYCMSSLATQSGPQIHFFTGAQCADMLYVMRAPKARCISALSWCVLILACGV